MGRKIAVIGSGYAGLVLAVGLSDFGNSVVAVDKDGKKIESLRKGVSPFYEPGLQEYLARNIESGRLVFSENAEEAAKGSEVVFLTVGTPTDSDGRVRLEDLMDAAHLVYQNVISETHIVVKSTVPVGTCRQLQSLAEKECRRIKVNVVSNPEFLREGRAVFDFFHPDRIVVGCQSESSRAIMEEIYRPLYLIQTPFIFCGWESSELAKYASNAFLATKIGFINEIANVADRVGADVHVVAKAMGMDGRIGSKFLHAGPGFGGGCFPKDLRAVIKLGESVGEQMMIARAVKTANEAQKTRAVKKVLDAVGELKGSAVAVLGLSFKAETDDIRESVSIPLVESLLEMGATVRVHDPKAMENFRALFPHIEYCSSEYEAVRGAAAVCICTEWNEYRNLNVDVMKALLQRPIVIDLRNILEKELFKRRGFSYFGTGRQ
jgi:UDPglucose 6-dehydrogenase